MSNSDKINIVSKVLRSVLDNDTPPGSDYTAEWQSLAGKILEDLEAPMKMNWEQHGICHYYHLALKGRKKVIFNILENDVGRFLCTLKFGDHLTLEGWVSTLEEGKKKLITYYNTNLASLPKLEIS